MRINTSRDIGNENTVTITINVDLTFVTETPNGEDVRRFAPRTIENIGYRN